MQWYWRRFFYYAKSWDVKRHLHICKYELFWHLMWIFFAIWMRQIQPTPWMHKQTNYEKALNSKGEWTFRHYHNSANVNGARMSIEMSLLLGSNNQLFQVKVGPSSLYFLTHYFVSTNKQTSKNKTEQLSFKLQRWMNL